MSGEVWYGSVRFGGLWCCRVRCDLAGLGMVRLGKVWYGPKGRSGVVRKGGVGSSKARCGVVGWGKVRFGSVGLC